MSVQLRYVIGRTLRMFLKMFQTLSNASPFVFSLTLWLIYLMCQAT